MNAYKENETKQVSWGARSFLWINGSFKMILPEMGWETSAQVICLDDNGNIGYLHLSQRRSSHSQYFIQQIKGNFAFCPDCDCLENGLPIVRDRLPGKLKNDKDGNPCF